MTPHPFVLFQRPHSSNNRLKNLLWSSLGYPHIGSRIRGKALFGLVHLPKGSLILDIGCGNGLFSFEARRRGYRVISLDKLVGVDFKDSLELRSIFSKGGYDFNPVIGDGACLPFLSDVFDGVIIADVLEHIPDDQHALQEICRVLKPRGFLYASTPSPGFHEGRFKPFFRMLRHAPLLNKLPIWNDAELSKKEMMENKGHLREYSKTQWEKLAKHFGMRVVDWRYEYKLFGALLVELYHSFLFFRTSSALSFYLFYPLVLIDALLPLNGTGIALSAQKTETGYD